MPWPIPSANPTSRSPRCCARFSSPGILRRGVDPLADQIPDPVPRQPAQTTRNRRTARRVSHHLQQQLGQILFLPPNVAGWDWGQAWINTNTLLTRYNLAGFLTKGAEEGGKAMQMEKGKTKGMASAAKRAGRGWKGPDYQKIAPRPLREDPAELVDSLIFRFFQGKLPEKARGSFIEYATAKKGVVFTDKEAAELCHLILSTPYYQLC
jgi:hypothetical protein